MMREDSPKTNSDSAKEKEQYLANELLFNQLFNNGLFGIITTNLQLQFLRVNPAFCQMTGYSEKELLELTLKEITHSEQQEQHISNMHKLLIGEIAKYQTTKRYIRKDKNEIWGTSTTTLVRDNKGDFMYFLTTVEDITLKKRSEEGLRKFRWGIVNSSDAIFLTDSNGNIEFANPAFEKMYGYSLSETIGNTPRILKSGLVSEDYYKNLWNSLLNKQTVNGQVTNKTKDGNLVHVENSNTPILNEVGSIIGFISINRAVPDRKQAETKIKTLSKAIEQGPSSIVITNAEGKIEFVNKKFTELTQYKLEDVIGTSPRIFNPGHIPEKEYKILWETLRKGDTWQGECLNRRKDKSTFWEEVIISAIKNESGSISNYILIKNNISEKKQILRDLISAKEKAEESDRLKSAFLANMSHELRTPLNSIIGFSNFMLDPFYEPEQHVEFAKIIKDNGNKLLEIISNIMDLSKIEAEQMTLTKNSLSVNQLINNIYTENIIKIIEKGLAWKENLIPREDVVIFADEIKLKQILDNFISNAIKFTNNGSIEIGYEQQGDFLKFHVKDTGIGIPPKYHEQIFEHFRQIETSNTRNYEGSGLGLAISKALINLMGGSVWVVSKPGVGSTFYFTIPIQ